MPAALTVPPVTIDFETEAIDSRPNYPPKPVGVSIKWFGKPAHYYAWGHPTENNCTLEQAKAALAAAWSHPGGVLCHNAKFDVDVAETHMGMPPLPWDRVHDTMFEVFLDDPHASSHGLKESAERILGMPPEEQQAVREWLIQNGYITRAVKRWGGLISKAPGDLVGRYAEGDVIRTEKLHKKLMPSLKRRKMLGALDRERKLMPVLLSMEREGVPVDLPRLRSDCAIYTEELEQLSKWCLRRLKAKHLNLDSGPELVVALIAAGKVDMGLMRKTKKGAWKTDKDTLAESITDPTLASALAHRASLMTCLKTFMLPWLRIAEQTGGKIHTTWNQLKQYGEAGNKTAGAVTGRVSSSPNFQNIPKEFPPFWKHQLDAELQRCKLEYAAKRSDIALEALHKCKAERDKLPKCPLPLSDLPLVRSYIIPPPGYVLVGRDYSQQELRILAHFEAGDMLEAYKADPWLDIHDHVREEISTSLRKDFARPIVKQINFGIIYGMGVDLMAHKAGCDSQEARAAKFAVLDTYPGLRGLQDGLRDLANNDLALRTWGGRQYHVEPPKMVDGELRTFEYKMLNVLVQGSAADCTKEAMIRYDEVRPKAHKLLLQVHDELLCAVPIPEMGEGMELLRENMESVKFDLPMLSDGKVSFTNWSEMVRYDKEGKIVYKEAV